MDKYYDYVRYFCIIKTRSNGVEKYVFRSFAGAPRLERGEELVDFEGSKLNNPPTKKRGKIFRKLRAKARAKNIPHVINLDT